MPFIVDGRYGGSILPPRTNTSLFIKADEQGIALSSGLDAEPSKVPTFILKIKE
jgi:hypothetical protein